jgi:hypothetical protein
MFEHDMQAVSVLSDTSSRSQLMGLFAVGSVAPVVNKHAHLPAPEPMPEEGSGGGNIDPEEDEGWSEDDEDDDEDAATGRCALKYVRV